MLVGRPKPRAPARRYLSTEEELLKAGATKDPILMEPIVNIKRQSKSRNQSFDYINYRPHHF